MINKNDVRNLAKSFSYAFSGILYCIKNERNMRIHLCMTVLVSFFAYFFRVTQTEYIILVLCFAMVIMSEMVNTAIETLTNLESPSYNNLARIAKDVAAGAVCVVAIATVIVGGFIFFKADKLYDTLQVIITNPIYIALFIVLIILSILFTFNGAKLFDEPKTKVYHMKNYDDKNINKKN